MSSNEYRGLTAKRQGPYLDLYDKDNHLVTGISLPLRYRARASRTYKVGTKYRETVSDALGDPEVKASIDRRLKRMGLLAK